MLYKEYVKIKNLIMIYDCYGKSLICADHDVMWESRALLLLDAMCELGDNGKYPESAALDSVLKFIKENPEASMLRKYMDHFISNYKEGVQPTIKDYEIHGFILHCLDDFRHRNQSNLGGVYFNDSLIEMNLKNIKNGLQLNIKTENVMIKIERNSVNYPHNFMVNNRSVPDIKMEELINLINYSNIVKDPTVVNTEAAYYFLR
jgi:hypothetical protein